MTTSESPVCHIRQLLIAMSSNPMDIDHQVGFHMDDDGGAVNSIPLDDVEAGIQANGETGNLKTSRGKKRASVY